jgi:hypothetical protein
MHWNRSNAIGLSKVACAYCHGDGVRTVWKTKEAPCNCVFRAVFRACFNRYRECVEAGKYSSMVSLEFCQGRDGGRTYSRKLEEYMADFCLVAKRTLDEDEHRTFRFYFLLGADWKLCSRQLKLDRGSLFHMVYRVQQKLGRAFAEIQPYPLYPVADYFAGTIRRVPPRSSSAAMPLGEVWAAELPLSA